MVNSTVIQVKLTIALLSILFALNEVAEFIDIACPQCLAC
jgi:hypothetical protein